LLYTTEICKHTASTTTSTLKSVCVSYTTTATATTSNY
jgi:hypothetical protein